MGSDNYNLTVSDNAGWSLSIFPNSLMIPPGENRAATLSVTIPENAEYCTEDLITVTATSQADSSVSDSASCITYKTFTLDLFPGWNLVGFSGVGENDTPNNLFAGLNYTMYYWNAPYGPYSEPNKNIPVEDNRGYWVFVNQSCTVLTTGTRPASENMHLTRGWNLVHFPVVNENTTPDKIFAPLKYNTDYIMYYWNAPGGPYSEPSPNQPIEDNRAYWVWINQDKTVTVP
jgi:hypothetical protein